MKKDIIKQQVLPIIERIAKRNAVASYADLARVFPKKLVSTDRGKAHLVYDKSMLAGDNYKQKEKIYVGGDEYWVLTESQTWKDHKDDILSHMRANPGVFDPQDIKDMDAVLAQLCAKSASVTTSASSTAAAKGGGSTAVPKGGTSLGGLKSLGDYYDYWESRYQEWKALRQIQDGWTDPDKPMYSKKPLYNDLDKIHDYSSLYVPEPWWGYDNMKDPEIPLHSLHSVVLNLNPGKGEGLQSFRNVGIFLAKNPKIRTYTDFVRSGYLTKTKDWHRDKRAIPILSALSELNEISEEEISLSSHLSVEMIPWHTAHASGTGYGAQYNSYVKQNIDMFFEHCISFAAEASRNIKNKKLHNKVIVRSSKDMFENVLKEIAKKGISNYTCSTVKTNPNGTSSKYVEFKLDIIDQYFVKNLTII